MATKTWNGMTAAYTTDADWSPTGTPGVGDVAIINAGTVTETGLLQASFVQVTAIPGNSPTLELNGGTVQSGNRLFVTGNGPLSILSITASSVNAGNVTLQGSSPEISIPAAGTPVTLTNTGGLSVTGSGSVVQSVGAGSIVNNGVISYRAAAGTSQTDSLFSTVTGTGQVRLTGSVDLTVSGQVANGQDVVFEQGAASLTLASFGSYQGDITGFSSNDVIFGVGARWDNVTYLQASGGGSGNLQFSAGGTVVDNLHFIGAYSPTTSFAVTQSANGGALSQTTIHVADAEPPARFNVNDQVTGVLSTETGVAYSDPNVPSLQYRYAYVGNHSVVLGANVPNVFMNGGSAGDALNASSGSNVLDGGGGSNFLVGASGADGGSDQFYVDERGSAETWSTLVNFHVRDSVTIFGFKPGTSTIPTPTIDGAGGYQGATIHSEINGAGTGVNGSVTFTGVSLADFSSKFTQQTGFLGDLGYLLITRTAA